jgi:hypothetical protein
VPGVDEFILQVFEIGVVEVEAALERSICHTLLALEECDHLFQDLVECHGRCPVYP